MMEVFKNGLLKVADIYGTAHARRLEQLFRNETAHFKSKQFLAGHSPGMEAAKGATEFPYGWTSLKQYWTINPQYKPIGLHSMVENTSALAKGIGVKQFIKFPSVEASMMSVAQLIMIRDGNFGKWFSKDPLFIEKYNGELDKIIPRLIK